MRGFRWFLLTLAVLLGLAGVGILPGFWWLVKNSMTTPSPNAGTFIPAPVWLGNWQETQPQGCLREVNGITHCYAITDITQVFAQGETVYRLAATQVAPALARCEQRQCPVYGVLADRASDQWQTLVLALPAEDLGWLPDSAPQGKTRRPWPTETPAIK